MADTTGMASQIESTKGVHASAIALISGFQAKLDAAIKAAVDANDEADLSALTDLSAQLKESSDALASAVESNP